MFSLEQQKFSKTYSTTYSHEAKQNSRHEAHIQHFQQASTYSHGDDLIYKHMLSLKIDSRPQFNDTATMIAKSILNHKQHN